METRTEYRVEYLDGWKWELYARTSDIILGEKYLNECRGKRSSPARLMEVKYKLIKGENDNVPAN